LRTVFSNNEKWISVCTKIKSPHEDFGFVNFVSIESDRNFESMTTSDILNLIPANYKHPYIFIVDKETISGIENPILCIDLKEKPRRNI
jgi:hypothetical protein